MTPTPPSTTSSSGGGQSPDAQYKVVRKRNRVPLSCGPCRHRKLKCNRTNPCENCVKRGDASSCSYAAPGTRRKNQSQGATSPDDMQNRIDRLEGLVLSLMTNGAQSAGPAAAAAAISRSQSDSAASSSLVFQAGGPDQGDDDMIKEEDEDSESEVEGVTNSLGVLKVDADQGKAMYLGDSHWHLVLQDIAEVKNYWTTHKMELEKNYERIRQSKPVSAMNGPAFLFSSHLPATDSDLRAELPPKSAVDKLITRYFNSYDPAVYVLHSPTFHKQLQKHWQNPAKTPMIHIGLIYAILCLAMQSYHKIGDEPLEWKGRTLELAAEYRLRTVQCLVNSDYTKSSEYTIETMLLYVHGEYTSRFDSEVGIWVIIGMIVRLAMRMGYHRDPSHYPGLTPFQGEMRRRVWAFVRTFDTIFSFQLALPGMIRHTDCDTAIPRNIFEDEFGVDSKVLPPARPLSEPTPVTYMITKTAIVFEFGAILEGINAVSGKSMAYDEVLKHDNRLRDLKNDMAPHLRLRPLEECTHDPANLLMQRYNIDIMWQKCMCVLHRKYIARARQNLRYSHSRRTCVDAGVEILRHQAKLHQESQPGGRMRSMKWFISSLTKSDYLLAAMIVCLDLYYDNMAESSPEPPVNYDKYFWSPTQRADMLGTLEASRQIWDQTAESSMEAFKASRILGIMLEKLRSPAPPCPTAEQQTTADAFAAFDNNLRPAEQSAAMTLGMLSGGLSPNSAAMFNGMGQSPRSGVNYAAVNGGGGGFDMPMGDAGLGQGFTDPFAQMNGMASPFSVFGNGGAAGNVNIDLPLDWDAWDSYVQNPGAIDPNFQFYPTTLDPNQASPETIQAQDVNGNVATGAGGGNSGNNSSTSPNVNANPNQGYSFGNSVFMGANTPGR